MNPERVERPMQLEDVDRIIRVAWYHGWHLTRPDANALWLDHSESWDAGYIGLPESDAELLEIISEALEEMG